MLEPNSRQLLRDALRPPTGYALDRAITTTFSLDLMALLVIPVSFTFFQLKDQDGPPQVDPLALLEALRRYAGKITVFCQAGQIHVPKHVQLLLGYLENSVYEVQSPQSRRGGVFHPKLTVLRYTVQDGNDSEEKLPPVTYRLLCSSRNLTFDRSWDTLLILDGVLAQHRTNAFARNHSLAHFVRDLPGLAVHPLTDRVATDVNSIADELLKVDFDVPDGFTDMEFCPLGLGWTPHWPILKHRRMLAMAPFVNDGFIKRCLDEDIPLGLISRVDSLDELSVAHLSQLFDAWYMNTAADPIPVDPEEEPHSAELGGTERATEAEDRIELTPALQLHGLHAKLFVSDDGWDSHVWTGSANATTAAFERNVEFMVHLTGKKSRCGIAKFVNVNDDDTDASAEGEINSGNDRTLGFSDLLLDYHRDEPPVIDGTRKALERVLDTARYALAGAKIVAHVEPFVGLLPTESTTTSFRVTLTRPSQDVIGLPHEVKIECHPLTLKANTALTVATPVGSAVVVFEPLSFEALTSFYAFRLSAAKDELNLSCGFVLNVPLIGAPADRQGRLLLALLRNREQLLKYLLMLLADDEESGRRLVETFDADGRNYHADGRDGGFGLPLLEPLLQSLDRQPARLDQIARLIEDLRQSPEGRQLVSKQFLSIWEPIWAARKGIGNGKR
jgi:hypothetical protein